MLSSGSNLKLVFKTPGLLRFSRKVERLLPISKLRRPVGIQLFLRKIKDGRWDNHSHQNPRFKS
jgi:hypothetical protein